MNTLELLSIDDSISECSLRRNYKESERTLKMEEQADLKSKKSFEMDPEPISIDGSIGKYSAESSYKNHLVKLSMIFLGKLMVATGLENTNSLIK